MVSKLVKSRIWWSRHKIQGFPLEFLLSSTTLAFKDVKMIKEQVYDDSVKL